jgi:hypothetical protein
MFLGCKLIKSQCLPLKSWKITVFGASLALQETGAALGSIRQVASLASKGFTKARAFSGAEMARLLAAVAGPAKSCETNLGWLKPDK